MVNGSQPTEATVTFAPPAAKKQAVPVAGANSKAVPARRAPTPSQKSSPTSAAAHASNGNGKHAPTHNPIPNRNSHTDAPGDDSERFFKDV
jgi:hypothetical protein